MFRPRRFRFSAPRPDSDSETERPVDPESHREPQLKPDVHASGESIYDSAEEKPSTFEPTGLEENPDPERPVEETPHSEHESESDDNPLLSSEYFTEPRPEQPASPIESLFSALLDFNQPLSTMATTTPAPKEINLNKPETFDGNRDKFKKFMQDVELYMDVNHEIYRDDLTKIAFILSFMNAGAAATWKTQFIDEANQRPAPADPRNKLGMYATFKTDLVDAFSMFDSAGDALDELRSLRMKKDDSIDEHIARFKLLAAEAKVDSNSTLTIEL